MRRKYTLSRASSPCNLLQDRDIPGLEDPLSPVKDHSLSMVEGELPSFTSTGMRSSEAMMSSKEK